MYRAWGWDFDHRTIEDAKAYARSNYHAMSIQREQGADTERPLSTRKRMAPIAAIELYLSDSTILTAMREAGWPTEPGAYLEA
jgi:hypothetical protein